jgi:hypothetical protein
MDSLPRLDLTRLQAVESRMVAPRRREEKAGDNAGPSKRKEMHNGSAEELERVGKRQRLDEEQLSSTLYQLRFIVGEKRSMTWNATGLRKVESASQADKYTFYLTKDAEGGRGGWRPIPKNCTPILATETDEGRYERARAHFSLLN